MTLGKHELLNNLIEDLITKSNGALANCVVTNERGLVVTGISKDGSSSQDLAAMISLISDTAVRVNNNLGFGAPKGVSIDGIGVTLALHEFLVQNKRFRIGGVIHEGFFKRYFFSRRRSIRYSINDMLQDTAKQVRSILES